MAGVAVSVSSRLVRPGGRQLHRPGQRAGFGHRDRGEPDAAWLMAAAVGQIDLVGEEKPVAGTRAPGTNPVAKVSGAELGCSPGCGKSTKTVQARYGGRQAFAEDGLVLPGPGRIRASCGLEMARVRGSYAVIEKWRAWGQRPLTTRR